MDVPTSRTSDGGGLHGRLHKLYPSPCRTFLHCARSRRISVLTTLARTPSVLAALARTSSSGLLSVGLNG